MINDIKDLEKFLKVCRKLGVTEISCHGISVKLGDLPSKNVQEDTDDVQTPDELTAEQMMFYAVNNGASQ